MRPALPLLNHPLQHNGSMTPLLHDRRALDRALVDLAVRGISAQELLIVEFCDTSGPDGLFRKYSAMRIGDTIIPRHLHAATKWIAKSASSADEEEPRPTPLCATQYAFRRPARAGACRLAYADGRGIQASGTRRCPAATSHCATGSTIDSVESGSTRPATGDRRADVPPGTGAEP